MRTTSGHDRLSATSRPARPLHSVSISSMSIGSLRRAGGVGKPGCNATNIALGRPFSGTRAPASAHHMTAGNDGIIDAVTATPVIRSIIQSTAASANTGRSTWAGRPLDYAIIFLPHRFRQWAARSSPSSSLPKPEIFSVITNLSRDVIVRGGLPADRHREVTRRVGRPYVRLQTIGAQYFRFAESRFWPGESISPRLCASQAAANETVSSLMGN